jgi:DNA repair protein RecO (recombination protein O)
MKQQTCPAIVLRRTNYAEADRIVTFLTPVGKVKAMVKGVRRSKSKLAGGIELFSENIITFLETRGDLSRVVSTRLEHYWDNIVGDLPRMMFGYEAMKLLDKAVEAEAERGYFELLKSTLAAIDDFELPLPAVETWFYVRYLQLQGREPNLKTDASGNKLADESFTFSIDDMCFVPHPSGQFKADHVKLLRLGLTHQPAFMKQIKDIKVLTEPLQPLFKQLVQSAP